MCVYVLCMHACACISSSHNILHMIIVTYVLHPYQSPGKWNTFQIEIQLCTIHNCIKDVDTVPQYLEGLGV
jgi:hypothetical protein